MKKADQAIKEMSMLEVALAQKTPVMEAEFAMDDRTSLNLFDCLVPKLREHRRFRIQKDAVFSIADFKEQVRVKTLQARLEKQEMPKLKAENATMAARIEQLESELYIVKWYMDVMEEGVDTKEIVQKYADLKKEHRILQKDSKKTIKKLTSQNRKLTTRLDEAMERLEK